MMNTPRIYFNFTLYFLQNKKASQAKERERQIAEGEKNNVYSARNVEAIKLKTILTERGLCIKEVSAATKEW